MRVFLLAVLCFLIAGLSYAESKEPPPAPAKAEQKNQTPAKHNQGSTSTDQRGAESSPLFIKVVPSLSIEPSPAEHAKQANDYTSPEWGIVWATLILAVITAILAGYTAKLWGATKSLAEDAKGTADRQTGEMKESLRIAGIAATAMDKVAENIAITASQQMRAYCTVIIGNAIYQESGRDIRFEGRPRIINTGHTPATKFAIGLVRPSCLLNCLTSSHSHFLTTLSVGQFWGRSIISILALSLMVHLSSMRMLKILNMGKGTYCMFGELLLIRMSLARIGRPSSARPLHGSVLGKMK